MIPSRDVLVTGGTGYLGTRLVARLVERGHRVRALARASSVAKVPPGAEVVVGDVLDEASVRAALREGDAIVHLVGTPHPSPSKAAEFVSIDLASIRSVVEAAAGSRVAHLVYVSVGQPAPAMKAYVAARAEGERLIAEKGFTATVLRPWYVLGPGHWWPVALIPIYALASLIPALRPGAQRLGLVTLSQMLDSLVFAVENPPESRTVRIVDVPAIRRRGA